MRRPIPPAASAMLSKDGRAQRNRAIMATVMSLLPVVWHKNNHTKTINKMTSLEI
jgi:uncharacterized membrane protein (UPF0127 family)